MISRGCTRRLDCSRRARYYRAPLALVVLPSLIRALNGSETVPQVHGPRAIRGTAVPRARSPVSACLLLMSVNVASGRQYGEDNTRFTTLQSNLADLYLRMDDLATAEMHLVAVRRARESAVQACPPA